MKIFRKITNGIILVIIGLMHTNLAISSDGFGYKFREFAKTFFYRISNGAEEFPVSSGKIDFEVHAAFWFFYFGILIIPFGLLLHSVERKQRIIPYSFTLSYLFVVIIGAYMIPKSGMTYFMLPHAIYMVVSNIIKSGKKLKS